MTPPFGQLPLMSWCQVCCALSCASCERQSATDLLWWHMVKRLLMAVPQGCFTFCIEAIRPNSQWQHSCTPCLPTNATCSPSQIKEESEVKWSAPREPPLMGMDLQQQQQHSTRRRWTHNEREREKENKKKYSGKKHFDALWPAPWAAVLEIYVKVFGSHGLSKKSPLRFLRTCRVLFFF